MTLLQVLLPTVSSRSLSKGIIIKARDWKESQRQGLEDIYDTHGRSLASIRREARRVKERMDKMMEEIEMTVASAGRNIVSKSFFVAHFNYLCKQIGTSTFLARQLLRNLTLRLELSR